jgi:hypothetical protein
LLVSNTYNKYFVHFLFAQKMNQKRAPEMATSAKPGARYTGLNGATVLTEVRTISGLPSRHHLENLNNIIKLLDLKRPQIILGGPSVKKLPGGQF